MKKVFLSIALAFSGMAAKAQAAEYFCYNAEGWIRLTVEPGASKFSYGKFDSPIIESPVPDKAIKTLNYPGESTIRILNFSDDSGDISFFVYARIANVVGSNSVHLQYDDKDGHHGMFVGGLTCKGV